MGVRAASRTTKSPGYWSNWTNLDRDIRAFIVQQGRAGCMPTQGMLIAAGRADLTNAIRAHGGYTRVAQELQLQHPRRMEAKHSGRYCPPTEAKVFSLLGLLAPDQFLAVQESLGVLTLLEMRCVRPRIVIQQQLGTREMRTLLPLLEAYPSSCSNETLIARCFVRTGRGTQLGGQEPLPRRRTHATVQALKNRLSSVSLDLGERGIQIAEVGKTAWGLIDPFAHPEGTEPTEELLHFPLLDLLRPGQLLAVQKSLKVVTLIGMRDGKPSIEGQYLLSPVEIAVSLPLLMAFPDPCSYDILLAHHVYRQHVTQEQIEHCRAQLIAAQQDGRWEQVLQGVRSALRRVNEKLWPWHVGITSVRGSGWVRLVKHVRAHEAI